MEKEEEEEAREKGTRRRYMGLRGWDEIEVRWKREGQEKREWTGTGLQKYTEEIKRFSPTFG